MARVLALLHATWEGGAYPPLAVAEVTGGASMLTMRRSSTGQIALLDWEDVCWTLGACDLGWMLVSSVDQPNGMP